MNYCYICTALLPSLETTEHNYLILPSSCDVHQTTLAPSVFQAKRSEAPSSTFLPMRHTDPGSQRAPWLMHCSTHQPPILYLPPYTMWDKAAVLGSLQPLRITPKDSLDPSRTRLQMSLCTCGGHCTPSKFHLSITSWA